MERLIAETSFLIDFERELSRRVRGPASAFMADNRRLEMAITPVIAGELASGTSLAVRSRWLDLVSRFRWLPHDEDVAWHYGMTHRYLRRQGLLIGANDLWIAAAGLAHDTPVVTRNVADFERVPGLRVLSY